MARVMFSLFLVFLLPITALGYSATVERVIDGDTILVKQYGEIEKIRLYGIDCPEAKQDYGSEATNFAKSLLQGKQVNILPQDEDRYGRIVAIVALADNRTAQEVLLENGYAWVYTKYCTTAPCLDWWYLQSEAQKLRKGLWEDTQPISPWKWRKK